MPNAGEASRRAAGAAPVSKTQRFWQIPSRLAAAALLLAALAGAAPAAELDWQEQTVRWGDDLAALLARAGLRLPAPAVDPVDREPVLARLYPGDRLRLGAAAGVLVAVDYDYAPGRRLELRWQDGWRVTHLKRPARGEPVAVGGVIEDTLYQSAQRAGLSREQALELAAIFDWEIDWSHDIAAGARFVVFFERDGDGRTGPILAARIDNAGRVHQAIRYRAADGRPAYFTPDGRSLKRRFLRNPVQHGVISSLFDPQRRHPVLSRIRAHRGVDYAAPPGTPVRAAADGVVAFVGRRGGYGLTVELIHDSRYSTLYAHLSRFARGLAPGLRLRQGQVLGYVGQSGLATGPHLHYELRVDGTHVDPLTIADTPVLPDAQDPEAFRRLAEHWRLRLAAAAATRLAQAP